MTTVGTLRKSCLILCDTRFISSRAWPTRSRLLLDICNDFAVYVLLRLTSQMPLKHSALDACLRLLLFLRLPFSRLVFCNLRPPHLRFSLFACCSFSCQFSIFLLVVCASMYIYTCITGKLVSSSFDYSPTRGIRCCCGSFRRSFVRSQRLHAMCFAFPCLRGLRLKARPQVGRPIAYALATLA